MSNDREDANDMREEIAKSRWVDTNNCEQSFHEFVGDQAIHPDGSVCESTEWNLAS